MLVVLLFISRLTLKRSMDKLILFNTSDVKHCLVATRGKTGLQKLLSVSDLNCQLLQRPLHSRYITWKQ